MPGRAPLRGALGALRAWLLGGFWVWALGGIYGPRAAALRAGTWGNPGAPRPCQAPQQWEGRQVLYRQSSGRNSRALLSYDGLNQRVRVLDERKALIPCKRYVGRRVDGRGGPVQGGLRGCAQVFDYQPVAEPPSYQRETLQGVSLGDIQQSRSLWKAGPTKGSLMAGTQWDLAGRWLIKKESVMGGIALSGARMQCAGRVSWRPLLPKACLLHYLFSSRSHLRGTYIFKNIYSLRISLYTPRGSKTAANLNTISPKSIC